MFRYLGVTLIAFLLVGCQFQEGETLPPLEITTNGGESPTKPVQTATAPIGVTTVATVLPSLLVEDSSQSCRPYQEEALIPILENKNLCVMQAEADASIKGTVWVYLVGPTTISQRNQWIEEVGIWLISRQLDSCRDKTIYLTEKPQAPLKEEVGRVPGEKAYYRLGGIQKPSFCLAP